MASTRGDIWFCADCSGSVSGSVNYFAEVLRMLEQTPRATAYFMWDGTLKEKSYEQMRAWAETRTGFGGTAPSVVAKLAAERSFHGTLRIITDGEVDGSEVDACDQCLHGEALEAGGTGHVFEKVEAAFVEIWRSPNLSALLPFTRFSPFEMKNLRSDGSRSDVDGVSAEDLELFEDFLRQRGGVDFEAKADRLKQVAQARFMGTRGSARVRDAAILVKKRLTEEMSARLGRDVGRQLAALLGGPSDRSDEAVRVAMEMVSDFATLKGEANSALKTLDEIVGLCDGVARKCFTKTEAERAISTPMQRAETLPEPSDRLPEASEVVAATAEEEQWFQCPVTLEEDASNLVLALAWPGGRAGESFVDGLEGDFKKLVASNPLWLWTRADCVERFASMCDELLSCQALRAAREAGTPIVASPTTRRPLAAAFPVSAVSEAHVKARRWALAQAVSGGKRWGNPELWFVNLVLAVARGKVNEKLRQALPVLLATLKAQLSSSETYASLSGLPELPMTKVPTSVACWLVAAGAVYEYPKMSLQLLPVRSEVLWVVKDLMGYALPPGAEVELERLSIVQVMRDWRMDRRPRGVSPSVFDGPRRLDNLLKALWQNWYRVHVEDALVARLRASSPIVEFVELDGGASEDQRRIVLELLPEAFREHARRHGWEDLLCLASFADTCRKPSECVPPMMQSPATVDAGYVVPAVDWAYGLKSYEPLVVPLCPSTCRPYSRVQIGKEKRAWREAAEAFYGNASDVLSCNENFGNFVRSRGFYPCEAELALYLRQKWISSGKKRTLPCQLKQFLEETWASAAPLASELRPAEFSARFTESCPLEIRRRLEETGEAE